MTPERLAVLARVADGLPDLDRPVLVAVDGGDGAGKTRFADDLARHLEGAGRVAVRASVDDFHHPRGHRHALGRTAETVWARSFDYRALRRDLLDPWCGGTGSPYRCRHHDLATDTLLDEPPAVVPEHGVLVVDGVFAQRDELREPTGRPPSGSTDCWRAADACASSPSSAPAASSGASGRTRVLVEPTLHRSLRPSRWCP